MEVPPPPAEAYYAHDAGIASDSRQDPPNLSGRTAAPPALPTGGQPSRQVLRGTPRHHHDAAALLRRALARSCKSGGFREITRFL